MRIKTVDRKHPNYHVGHLIVDTFSSRPDAICQIDAATGESETNASVLARSIQLAKCFRKFGARPGDVLALGGRNHLDVHIPYYAGIMNGYPLTGVDPQFKYSEIKQHFKLSSPTIAFCQKEKFDVYIKVVKELGLNTKVICFDEGPHSLKNFIGEYDDNDNEEFKPAIFEVDKHYIWLVSTGGTSGTVKLAAFKQRVVLKKIEEVRPIFKGKDSPNDENSPTLILSPVQWLTGFLYALWQPVYKQIKIMTSDPMTPENVIDMINKYRPTVGFLSPPLATTMLNSDKTCDFTCFDSLVIGGSKVYPGLLLRLKEKMRPDAPVFEGYGQTENCGAILFPAPDGPLGNCGNGVFPGYQVKLVDPDTRKEILQPNVPGEMWTKADGFTEYYKNPEETAAVFEDGWFKTGDIFYRDEQGYFFFIERLKMLIKYRSYHVIPTELEAVIRLHKAVLDVSVTCVDHEVDGEHPVACVVRRPGATVTAQELKNLIADHLSDSQRLRGGVVFMEKIPLTSTSKVARGRLRRMVVDLHRE